MKAIKGGRPPTKETGPSCAKCRFLTTAKGVPVCAVNLPFEHPCAKFEDASKPLRRLWGGVSGVAAK
jgi:hypothetical protein